MDNLYFDAKELPLLSDSSGWKVACSFFKPDIKPVSHPNQEKQKWRETHTHKHSHIEFMFTLSGLTYYGVGGKVYPCKPGTLLVFDAYEPHDLGYREANSRARHLWVSVMPGKFLVREVNVGQYVQGHREKPNLLIANEDAGLDLHQVINYCRERRNLPEELRKARLVSAIQLLTSYIIGCGYETTPSCPKSFQEDVIDTICKHIRATAGRGVSVEGMANLAGYSKFYFLRLFKKHTGYSVHTFVDECRRRRVSELKSSGYSLKEIGNELGFSCPAAFSRWLRKNS